MINKTASELLREFEKPFNVRNFEAENKELRRIVEKTCQASLEVVNANKELTSLLELIHKDLKIRADENNVVDLSSFIWLRLCEILKR